MKRTSVLSSLTLGAGLALSGCASKGETPRVESAEKPSAVVADQAEVRTTVEAVDYPARRVTLRGPEGRTVSVGAPDDLKNLENVRVGDTVVARYVESVAIAVEGPGEPPTASQTRFRDVQVGDQIVVQYTEAIGLSLERS